ncbi:TadE/TadG family type IV pilus assembly protein [Streptomyces yaizuensis]|uniref:Pilus assembly protein n=1 Tax=Streptomyces yaizuensis TaxID=2989713 RepID=A0ABQ5NVI8_9ACTN|nr:TadE family protein [Streptomyces sp. YSPA8]GLF94376.1 pilus assembly protein [Streptomyces sp. YSPA8]
MSGRRERGQAAIEFAGIITLLLVVALAAIQLGLVAYAAQQAGTAARAAARTATQDDDGPGRATAAGHAALSDWLDADISGVPASCEGEGEVTVTVRVQVPELLPGFDAGAAERRVTMPCD